MRNRTGLKIGDVILMAGIFIAAIVLFLLPFLADRATGAEIVIAETGEVRQISLGKDASYTVSSRGVTLTVEVAGGEVSVSQTDCRDGICQNTPPVSRAGQSIVCAPAGVVVRVVGEEAEVDGVSG